MKKCIVTLNSTSGAVPCFNCVRGVSVPWIWISSPPIFYRISQTFCALCQESGWRTTHWIGGIPSCSLWFVTAETYGLQHFSNNTSSSSSKIIGIIIKSTSENFAILGNIDFTLYGITMDVYATETIQISLTLSGYGSDVCVNRHLTWKVCMVLN